jgi:TonB family protein
MNAVSRWRYEPPARAPISLYVKIGFAPGADGELLWHDARPPDPPPPATSQTSSTGVQGGVPGGVPGGIVAGLTSAAPPAGPVRVGGTIKPPRKIKDVPPVYPPAAQAARVQGVVIIEAVIGTSGRVSEAKVIRSVDLLDQAALDAVRQWEFEPTLLNGEPIAIIMGVTVNFVLKSQSPASPPGPPPAAPPSAPPN